MKSLTATLVALFLVTTAEAQLLDIMRLEYSSVPSSGSNFDYKRKRAVINVPIMLKTDKYLFVGLDYSDIDLEFKEDFPQFDETKTDEFRLVDINFAYITKINEDWRFAARLVPGFSSNLESRSLLFDDTILSGAIVFIKDKKEADDVPKPYRVIVGMAYSGNSGIVVPIPFVSYYKKFRPRWSYNVGVPTMNLQYHASERLRLKLFGQLEGFNSNLQDGLPVNGDFADQIRMTMILLGFRYEFKVADRIELYAITTHSVRTRIQLRMQRQNILSLDRSEVPHIRAGIRVKI